MSLSLSRREFIAQTPAGAFVGMTTVPPPRAWILLQENWEHNDEFNYASGEIAHSAL